MPGFDGTGPMGRGPVTGGGFGYCHRLTVIPEIPVRFMDTVHTTPMAAIQLAWSPCEAGAEAGVGGAAAAGGSRLC